MSGRCPIILCRSPRCVRTLKSIGLGPSESSFQSPERTARCGEAPITRQKSVRSISGTRPSSTGNRLIPSRALRAAVVVGEDHDCVLPQAKAVEETEDPADALIGALEHRDVLRARARRIVEGSEVPGIIACPGRLVGRLVRPMRGVVRDVDEERALRVLLDEPHGSLGDEVRHVARDLDGTLVLEQVGLPIAVGVLVVIGEAALEAEEIAKRCWYRPEMRPARVGVQVAPFA